MGPGSAGWEGQGLHFTIRTSRVNRPRTDKPAGRKVRVAKKQNPAIAGGVWVFSARKEPAERLWPYRQAGILASSSDGSRSTYPRPHTVSM
jgi:hypothetical protein